MTSKKHKSADDKTETPEDFADKKEPRFLEMWAHLAERGVCDAPGGAEYRRVLASWISARRPEPLVSYIRREANRTPEGHG